MLRINADGTIPTNNPFYNTATGNNRAIWALGLRNPFTFAFQPDTTRLFINDVGQSTWEEINDGSDQQSGVPEWNNEKASFLVILSDLAFSNLPFALSRMIVK